MFIEKLKDEEILEFLKNAIFIFCDNINKCGSVNRYGDAVSVFVKLDNGVTRIITLNDFNVGSDREFTDVPSLKFKWKNYMHKKFGEEYKQAFNENLKKNYEEEMIK